LLLKKLTQSAGAIVRSFQRASETRGSRPKELKPLSSCGKESVTASHRNESSIHGEGDGVVSANGGAPSATTVLSSDSVPNTDNAKASNQESIKGPRRRRRRKRKAHHDKQHFAPKKACSPISKH
jgi:hypothetical protein